MEEATEAYLFLFDKQKLLLFFLSQCAPTRATASTFLGLLDHKQRRITVRRTHLDELSARHRDLYFTTEKHS